MNDKKLVKEVESIGVSNPYALAELIEDEEIEWDEMEDVEGFLESTLGTSYDELFDPKYGSPLYAGLTLTEDNTVERMSPDEMKREKMETEADTLTPDVEVSSEPDTEMPSSVGTLPSEVRELLVGSPRKEDDEVAMDGGMSLDADVSVEETTEPTLERLDDEASTDIEVEVTDVGPEVKSMQSKTELTTDLERTVSVGWEPRGIDWIDAGEFFKQGAEQFDPVQGAVGDCYLIAALSAVAWTKPSLIRHTAFADTEEHKSYFRFFDGSSPRYVVAGERLPLREGSHNFVYARSGEREEVWPAVYEKAYAKWKTGATDDKPEIPAISGGDPVRACAEIAGSGRKYYGTRTRSGNQLWDIVRGNSRGAKTFNPMVAWTYPTDNAAPDNIDYSSAGIVANHAYTVLGWMYRSGKRYIVCRNPWGRHEATTGVVGGSYSYIDDGAWRSIPLGESDGVFAIDADTFKRYFAGIGVNA
ncbi:C2 family cysteine protease [Haladaptatus sp. NG-SE-30]